MKGKFRAFAIGGVLGAAVALLYAPKTGDQLRNELKEKLDELTEQGRVGYQDNRERVLQAVDSGTETATQATEDLKNRIREAREKLKEQVDAAAGSAREKIASATGQDAETDEAAPAGGPGEPAGK